MKSKYSLKRRLLREAEEEGAGLDPSYDEALEIAGEPELSAADMENPGGIQNVPDDMIDDADNIFDEVEEEVQ